MEKQTLEQAGSSGEPGEAIEPSGETFWSKIKRSRAYKILAPILFLLALAGKVLKPLLVVLKLSKLGGTFISMLSTVVVYALFWGWKFALGFVLLILVHENGHMLVARREGLPVSNPVFIPFVGAFINLKEMPRDARQEAAIGLGGPLLGGLASLVCLGVFALGGGSYWLALGYTGCFLNLFNLVPFSFLDGGRIATAISLWLWLPGAILLGVLAFKLGNLLLVVILLLGLWEAWGIFKKRHSPEFTAYYDLPGAFRLRMGLVYLSMLVVLGLGMSYAHDLLVRLQPQLIR
ncbi:MAG: site-2 protease family protein [Desulfurispora sp.]|uniref:site-2 protease family protein n=1 Tax=Desulfurispora sp. TaxID=3014275 RepID=UPI0040499D61